MTKMKPTNQHDARGASRRAPAYQPPRVVLYSEEALLERLGPAKACASFPVFGSADRNQDRPSGRKTFELDL